MVLLIEDEDESTDDCIIVYDTNDCIIIDDDNHEVENEMEVTDLTKDDQYERFRHFLIESC